MVTAKTQAGTQIFYWRFKMTEEVKSVSNMIRITAENTTEFMEQVAKHIEKLEEAVKGLQNRITELEESQK
jgi:methyl-accepting chemotaxis protein